MSEGIWFSCDFFEAMEQLRAGKTVRSNLGDTYKIKSGLVSRDDSESRYMMFSRGEINGQWEYFEPADGGAA